MLCTTERVSSGTFVGTIFCVWIQAFFEIFIIYMLKFKIIINYYLHLILNSNFNNFNFNYYYFVFVAVV